MTDTEDLIRLVKTTPITLREWYRQKEIHQASDLTQPLELGFATFFLNRTNRSGVIKGAGVIGGLAQKGSYKIGCRFNREDLTRRILRIHKYRSRIHFSRLDAVPFMQKMSAKLPAESFFCIDPPYFKKGASLYTNFYGPDEHRAVAAAVLEIKQPWMVTYDYDEHIQKLYSRRRQFIFQINYSVQTKRVGSELLIASSRLKLPDPIAAQRTFPPKLLVA